MSTSSPSSAFGSILQHAAAANGRLKAGAGALLPEAMKTKKGRRRHRSANSNEDDEEDEVSERDAVIDSTQRT